MDSFIIKNFVIKKLYNNNLELLCVSIQNPDFESIKNICTGNTVDDIENIYDEVQKLYHFY